MNLLISNDSKSIIGEIQFLQSWQLRAKKIGHKLYSIRRRKPFLNNVTKHISNDLNYQIFCKKILLDFNNKNIYDINQQLFYSPNIVISIISHNDDICRPLLYYVCSHSSLHTFNLFFQTMIHLQECLLGGDSKYELMKKYLNYDLGEPVIHKSIFWGVRGGSFKVNQQGKYSSLNIDQFKKMETIMSSKYFNGIKRKDIILFTCRRHNCIEYLQLISKYREKNVICIKDGLNWCYQHDKMTPLLHLVRNEHCNEEYLKTLLSLGDKIGEYECKVDLMVKDVKNDRTVLKYLERFNKPKEWIDIIVQYGKKTNQSLKEKEQEKEKKEEQGDKTKAK